MDYIETLQAARRRRKQMVALRNRGWKVIEIAEKMGITPQRVSYLLGREKRRNVGKLNTYSSGKKHVKD